MSIVISLLLTCQAWADYPQVDTSLGKDSSTLEGPPLGFGVGAVLGVPTGLTSSWRPGDFFALQASLAWHGQEERVSTSVDLLINIMDLESKDLEDGRFVAYVGTGLVVRWGWIRSVKLTAWQIERPMMGIRIPAGVVYLPEDRRLDVFLEFAPTFYVVPESEMDLSASLGARLYFGGPRTHL